jgi:hypothetical protein
MKVNCFTCGQRLEIPLPLPPLDKTVLGKLPEQVPPPAAVSPPPLLQISEPPDEGIVTAELVAEPRGRRDRGEEPRRKRRRRHDDDDDDDDDDAGRFRCPYCRTKARPIIKQEVSSTGWIILVVLLICCFPFFWIGLLVKEDQRVCSRCGIKLG